MREFNTFEEALKEFENKTESYIKSKNFNTFLISLGKEKTIIEIIKNLESMNDKKVFIDFIEKSKPNYIKKESDKNGGFFYYYNEKIIWYPKITNDLEKIEEIVKEKNFNKPKYYILKNEKKGFENFENALFECKKQKTKISFIF